MILDPYFRGTWRVVSREDDPFLDVGDVVTLTYESYKTYVEIENRPDVEVGGNVGHEDGVTGGLEKGGVRRSYSILRHTPYGGVGKKKMVSCREVETRGSVVMCPGRWIGEAVEEEDGEESRQ